MEGELAEGVGEQKPTSHNQNTTTNRAPKTTTTQEFPAPFLNNLDISSQISAPKSRLHLKLQIVI